MNGGLKPSLTIARSAIIEARRGGLPWVALAMLAAAIGLAGFLSRLALTESVALQASTAAALLRVGAAFVLVAQVVASTQREADTKVLELMLSMPLSRTQYYLGRLAGFAAIGAVLASACSIMLLLWCAPAEVALWGVSLAIELALAASAALLFALSLVQPMPALAASAGLYLLGRTIGAMQAIASGPLTDESLAQRAARLALDGVALLAPRLDAATRGEWLLYGAPPADEYLASIASLVVYAALLAAAGLFDFHRRNL
jgi:ABC-type multidrug transport system permease subunit